MTRPRVERPKLERIVLDDDRMIALLTSINGVLIERRASLDETLSASITLLARAIHLYGVSFDGQLAMLDAAGREVRDLLMEHLDDPAPRAPRRRRAA